jgi:hypothetical protein
MEFVHSAPFAFVAKGLRATAMECDSGYFNLATVGDLVFYSLACLIVPPSCEPFAVTTRQEI